MTPVKGGIPKSPWSPPSSPDSPPLQPGNLTKLLQPSIGTSKRSESTLDLTDAAISQPLQGWSIPTLAWPFHSQIAERLYVSAGSEWGLPP